MKKSENYYKQILVLQKLPEMILLDTNFGRSLKVMDIKLFIKTSIFQKKNYFLKSLILNI